MNPLAKDAAVLYVEDDPNDVLFMRLGFANAGLSQPLHIARDGGQAIAYLAGNGPYTDREKFPLPALMMLDLKLPTVSGLEVLRWLRRQSQFQSLPVVIFSAFDEGTDREQARQLGVIDYLVKPSDMTRLPELLKPLTQQSLNL